jgi:hypothetical protein
MKSTLLSIILSLLSIVAYGQARLNHSASEIKTEFQDEKYNLQEGFDEDGDYFIAIETELASIVFFFNADKYCTSSIIDPNDESALKFYVELYNKHHVIISSKHWRIYSENGIANIQLIYPEGGGYFFLTTIEN